MASAGPHPHNQPFYGSKDPRTGATLHPNTGEGFPPQGTPPKGKKGRGGRHRGKRMKKHGY